MDDKKDSLSSFVSWNDLARFRLAYNKAKKEQKPEFEWNGDIVLTQYAKYVLELMDSKPRFK